MTRENVPSTRTILLSVFIFFTVIYAIDLSLPLGVAVGMLYVAPVLVTFWSPQIRYTIIVALAGSALTVLGSYYSPPPAEGVLWMAVINRFFSITIIWVTALVLIRLKIAQKKLNLTFKELNDLKYALDESAIVAKTDANGVILYVNDTFCEISKYSREELIGKTHRVVNSGYHPDEFFKEMWQTISSGKVWRGEIRNRAKDGKCYWVNSTIVPFLDDDGKPYQYISIRKDITLRKEMEEIVKQLPQRIIQAQEAERERISREIHDDLGQSLATLKMHIQSSLPEALENKTQLKKAYERSIEYINSIIDKTRKMASGLRPSTLEVLGLAPAIESLIQEFRSVHKLNVEYHTVPLDHYQFHGEKINLYRIIQEALTNIVKHSKAKHVGVVIKIEDQHKLILRITDDGNGNVSFDKDGAINWKKSGLGLSTMQERAKLLEGSFKIEPIKNRGTTIIIEAPVVLIRR